MVTFRSRSFYSLHNTADTYAMKINKLDQLWNKSLPQRDTQMQRVEHTARHKVWLNLRSHTLALAANTQIFQEEGRKLSQHEQAPRAR